MKMGMVGSSASNPAPCGTFSSSTMMVMMMAITPSLKASSRVLLMGGSSSGRRFPRVRLQRDEMRVYHTARHRGDIHRISHDAQEGELKAHHRDLGVRVGAGDLV